MTLTTTTPATAAQRSYLEDLCRANPANTVCGGGQDLTSEVKTMIAGWDKAKASEMIDALKAFNREQGFTTARQQAQGRKPRRSRTRWDNGFYCRDAGYRFGSRFEHEQDCQFCA